MRRKEIIGLTVACLLVLGAMRSVQAQDFVSSGIAESVKIVDETVNVGDIVCLKESEYELCKEAYSQNIRGVITEEPAVAFEAEASEGAKLVQTSGTVVVRVSGAGEIKKGDFVTSSENAGVGQKADKNGYVIGKAVEDFTPQNPEEVGKVLVALDVHPTVELGGGTGGNLWTTLKQGLQAPMISPLAALRYVLAGAMVVLSFILGSLNFGRVAQTGVEAIGRNPLAGRTIQLAVVFNILLSVVVVLAGVGIGYLILAL